MYKILVVDDHQIVRNGIKRIISEESDMMVSHEASNAMEAYDILNKEKFDAIILDISMPHISGFEALKKIKQLYPDLPVLMISSLSEDIFASKCIKAGAAGFLKKESAPDELIIALRSTLSKGKYVSPDYFDQLTSEIKDEVKVASYKQLNEREFQVLLMLGSGEKIGSIAKKLMLSVNTVNTYRANILEKLNLENNNDIIRYCLDNKLIE